MTIPECQVVVEAALVALEHECAAAARLRRLTDERKAIARALPLAGLYGIERAPLVARLDQLAVELTEDVSPGEIPQHPIRSVPMDLITLAVIRRVLQIPHDFPILGIKAEPSQAHVADALAHIAARWQTTAGPTLDPEPRVLA